MVLRYAATVATRDGGVQPIPALKRSRAARERPDPPTAGAAAEKESTEPHGGRRGEARSKRDKEVACRDPEQRIASGLSETEVETIVTALCAVAESVETRFLRRPACCAAGRPTPAAAPILSRTAATYTLQPLPATAAARQAPRRTRRSGGTVRVAPAAPGRRARY